MVFQLDDQWVFRIFRPEAVQVFLVGEGQGPRLDARVLPMRRMGGFWQTRLSLPPGEHHFRYYAARSASAFGPRTGAAMDSRPRTALVGGSTLYVPREEADAGRGEHKLN